MKRKRLGHLHVVHLQNSMKSSLARPEASFEYLCGITSHAVHQNTHTKAPDRLQRMHATVRVECVGAVYTILLFLTCRSSPIRHRCRHRRTSCTSQIYRPVACFLSAPKAALFVFICFLLYFEANCPNKARGSQPVQRSFGLAILGRSANPASSFVLLFF
jgi:hypothetical protein